MVRDGSEIREFAEQVLCGPSLADKLVRPSRITDRQPHVNFLLPKEPARPPHLPFSTRGRVVKSFPTVGSLDAEPERGLVLHYFANHELLALELMALCLLKYPEAPSAFRRGLVATMWEEQDHLKLYETRMAERGVRFGDFPVNQFFWRATADVSSPLGFVAAMSMTLEQANLDFSLYYLQLFRQMGDCASASIMERVYREEIGHVKHGLGWFEKWRSGKRSSFEEYIALLDHPLTPRRAKGRIFDTAGRKAAGFDDDFISKLAIYSSSRGRPPRIYLFDPSIETSLAGHSPKPAQTQFRRDYSHIMMFLAGEDDVILVDRTHSDQHFANLQSLGYALPERVTPPEELKLSARQWGGVEPWGVSPDVVRRLAKIREHLPLSIQATRDCSSKAFARDRRQEFLAANRDPLWGDDQTWVASSLSQVESALAAISANGFELAVLKAPLGASGQNMKRHVAANPLPVNYVGWVEKVMRRQGCLLIEPWLDRCLDFGIQIDTRASDPYLGWTLYFTSASGRIRGYHLGHKLAVMPAVLRAALHQGIEGGLQARGRQLANYTQTLLTSQGYKGPAGIDCFLYRRGSGLVGRPLVEINVRYTMGHVALQLERKLAPGVQAIWYWLLPDDIYSLGWPNFDSFARHAQNLRPPRRGRGGIETGIFFTNDPCQAVGNLGMVWVQPGGGSPGDCLMKLRSEEQHGTL